MPKRFVMIGLVLIRLCLWQATASAEKLPEDACKAIRNFAVTVEQVIPTTLSVTDWRGLSEKMFDAKFKVMLVTKKYEKEPWYEGYHMAITKIMYNVEHLELAKPSGKQVINDLKEIQNGIKELRSLCDPK
jgi:hypothetical protein